MQVIAVQKAATHLEAAKRAIRGMETATSFAAFEEHWSRFLEESHRVFSKLEKGAKGVGPSNGWFGRKKGQRRTDELLKYVHQARNSDEHGIEDIVRREADSFSVDAVSHGGEMTFSVEAKLADDGSIMMRNPTVQGATPTAIRFENARVSLIPVHNDQFNDTFHPPTSYLGKPLPNRGPISVAKCAIEYMDEMLAEAAPYAKG